MGLWAELEQHSAFSPDDQEGLLKRWFEAPVCLQRLLQPHQCA